jgi:DNA polymerase III delta subunit
MATTNGKRFLWLDDGDLHAARQSLEKIKWGRSSWKWVRWDEDDYADSEEAFSALFSELGTPSMFEPGKVVCCHGVPKCQAEIAGIIQKIPENALLIVIGKPNKTLSLFKTASSDRERCEVSECPSFASWGEEARIRWVRERAESLGMSIDDQSCALLLDTFGFVPNLLHPEVAKLKHVASDGVVRSWMVAELCRGPGNADLPSLGRAIVHARAPEAHELLCRLLDRHESPFAICGFMVSMVRKLACVPEYRADEKGTLKKLTKVYKFDRDTDDEKVKKKDYEKALEDGPIYREGGWGVPVQMFSGSNPLYYSVKDLEESGRGDSWLEVARRETMGLDIRLKKCENDPARQARVLHEYVDRMIGG